MNGKLTNIIAVYAALWADVLYNGKLSVHLKKIENDIAFIGMLITLAHFHNKESAESVMLDKIRQQLVLMSKTIKKRIG